MIASTARRRALFAMALAALLAAAAIASLAYWRNPRRGLPYRDSFAAGEAQEWQAFGGTWEVAQGAMRNDSDERGAKLLTGSPHWQDYSIEGDVMLLGLGGDAGFIVRSSKEEEGVDAYNGYYAGLRSIDNSLVLGRAGYGWMEAPFPLRAPRPPVRPSVWYHLKLLAYGCRLVATANALSTGQAVFASTVASIADEDCIREGRVGLRSYSSGGVWRNIVVRPSTQAEADQMLAEARSQAGPSAGHALAGLPASDLAPEIPRGDQPRELPSSLSTQPISSLRLMSLSAPARAAVRGLVILTSPAVFVQDATGGVSIQQSAPAALKVGDEVEVTGDVRSGAFSLALENAAVRVLWEGTPMPAISVTASQAATGAFDATFVEVEGILRQKEFGPGDALTFDFDAGPQSFRAIVNRGRGNYLYRQLKLNSLVRLRGVAVVDPAYTANVTPFAVLVRSTDDVQTVAGPPWWSAGHVLAITLGLLILALIANFLYHRIENWRLRAVVEERERLAYEMHDTLAQSVAGIGFQLEAIRVGMPEDLTKAHRQLDLATELVRQSHAEARRSVDMLRPQQLESERLLDALTGCAHRLVAGGSVQVAAASTGDARPLSLRVADTLYRIGQEALANAVRHAHPATLVIALQYKRNHVRLLIADDGPGIGGEHAEGGFGILAMRKRAASISAKLEIGPNGEQGTLVAVTAPLPPRVTLTSWPVFLGRFLRERARNVPTTGKPHPHPYSR